MNKIFYSCLLLNLWCKQKVLNMVSCRLSVHRTLPSMQTLNWDALNMRLKLVFIWPVCNKKRPGRLVCKWCEVEYTSSHHAVLIIRGAGGGLRERYRLFGVVENQRLGERLRLRDLQWSGLGLGGGRGRRFSQQHREIDPSVKQGKR